MKNRIKEILERDEIVNCPHCKASYIALETIYDDICGVCNRYMYDNYEETSDEYSDEIYTEDDMKQIIKELNYE